jgi:putative PIN family toxin of toxin-antitoxin system
VRVVIDTNIMVASLFPGTSKRLIEAWASGRLTLCVSRPILGEYEAILRRFAFREGELRRLREALETSPHTLCAVHPPEGRWVPEDPEDDKFVACALALEAVCIVTSDEHLGAMERVQGVEVLSPARALSRLTGRGPKR